MNLADNTIIEVIAKVYNVDVETIIYEYKKFGDLAEVAKRHWKGNPDANEIEISKLLESLKEITSTKGIGSKDLKMDLLADLITNMKTQNEVFFLIRFLQVYFFLHFKD
jgi:ATP-dependent DNA ligase